MIMLKSIKAILEERCGAIIGPVDQLIRERLRKEERLCMGYASLLVSPTCVLLFSLPSCFLQVELGSIVEPSFVNQGEHDGCWYLDIL